MSKKLLTVCMALAAAGALAIPAAASASPVLTDLKGWVITPVFVEIVPLGPVKFTNTENTRTELECSTGTMSGEVTKNSGTEFEGKITSAVFGGTGAQATGEPAPECTGESVFGNASLTAVVSSKAPWCIRSTGEDRFSISGGACPGGGTLRYKMVTTLAGTCEYESTGGIGGTYNTGGTFANFTVTSTHGTENGFKLIAGGFACPTSYMLTQSVTIRTAFTNEDIWVS